MRRQRLAGPIAVAVLLFGCGGSSRAGGSASDSGPGAQAPGTTNVVGSDGSSTIVAPPPGGSANNDTTPAIVAGGPDGRPRDPTGPPGSFAPAYLRPSESSEVVVEIRAQSGAGPQQASIDHLVSVLRSVTAEPVSVVGGAPVDGGARSWSPADVRAEGNAGAVQGMGRAVLHVLFVHGSLGGDSSVLGSAVQGDTAAVFTDQVRASATPLVGSAGIETAVVTHEVGHLLGLVDLYLHTGRQDAAHPGHSTNEGSVMYWAVESNVVADLLQGGPPKDFDSADLADLATVRNGG